MKLLTKEIERKLEKTPIYTHDGKAPEDVPIIVKFFTPWSNWTWYVTEGEKTKDGDWLLFGLVEGLETEAGYFRLSELAEVKGPWGLKIERDIHFAGTLADVNKGVLA